MKTQIARFFIGFSTLEELLKNLSGAGEIYVTASTRTRTGTYNIQMASWLVNVAVISDERCYYWQKQTGASSAVAGSPLGDEQEKSRIRTDKFLTLLKEEILRRCPGTKIVEAMVSFPSDLEILQGTTDLFIYDKESDSYRKAGKKTADFAV